MRWFYIVIIIVIFGHLAHLPEAGEPAVEGIAETIALEAQVPNAITGILLRNRLYDTLFEVLVFTLAVLGVKHTLSQGEPEDEIVQLHEPTMVILARLGGLVSALVFLELAVRGHLAPGGGFAAGVAGGTALCLVTLTSSAHELYEQHRRWHIAAIEKMIVLFFLCIAGLMFLMPDLTLAIPVMNILIAGKVAIGSWTIVLLFIRHRGLL
ncbi:MAG: cation:proton antiporter [Verrucomicrobia bacterium]|nr:MAG: cation:proton antiporter [Verrucomicrobiota bacterium]